jgi:hypothetical protein
MALQIRAGVTDGDIEPNPKEDPQEKKHGVQHQRDSSRRAIARGHAHLRRHCSGDKKDEQRCRTYTAHAPDYVRKPEEWDEQQRAIAKRSEAVQDQRWDSGGDKAADEDYYI